MRTLMRLVGKALSRFGARREMPAESGVEAITRLLNDISPVDVQPPKVGNHPTGVNGAVGVIRRGNRSKE